jgi:hypothetical protein
VRLRMWGEEEGVGARESEGVAAGLSGRYYRARRARGATVGVMAINGHGGPVFKAFKGEGS